jgi:hypothetical protein
MFNNLAEAFISSRGVAIGRTNDRDAFAPVLERYLGEPGHSFSLSASATYVVDATVSSVPKPFNGKSCWMASGTCKPKEPSLKEAARA